MKFTVPGEPVGKARPRMNRKTGNVYTPKASSDYEDTVAWCARAQPERFGKGVPLKLTVDFFCTPKKRQHTIDGDNLLKALLDGINKSGVIDDDVDFVSLHVYRWEDNDPRAEVVLEAI